MPTIAFTTISNTAIPAILKHLTDKGMRPSLEGNTIYLDVPEAVTASRLPDWCFSLGRTIGAIELSQFTRSTFM